MWLSAASHASARVTKLKFGSTWPKLLDRIVSGEVVILLLATPLFWFPDRFGFSGPLLIVSLWAARWISRGQPSVRTAYDVPLAVFVVLIPLMMLATIDWRLVEPKLFGIVDGVALLYALANVRLPAKRALSLGHLLVCLMGVGIALVGLVETDWNFGKFALLDALYSRLPVLVKGVVRGTPQGGIHPNEIAGMLVLLLPCVVTGALTCLRRVGSGHGYRRWLALFTVSGALMAGMLLLTQSRSGLLGLLTSLLFVLAWAALGLPVSRSARLAWGTVAITVFAIAGLAVWQLLARWVIGGGEGGDSFPSRLELWGRGLSMLWDFPFTGVGLGQFGLLLDLLYPVFSHLGVSVPHAHNFLLQLALDCGLPGAIAIVFVLVAFFRILWRAYRANRSLALRAFAIGLAAGMIGFLTYGITDAIALGARGGVVLWIVLGVAAALNESVLRRPGFQPGSGVDAKGNRATVSQ